MMPTRVSPSTIEKQSMPSSIIIASIWAISAPGVNDATGVIITSHTVTHRVLCNRPNFRAGPADLTVSLGARI